MNMLLAQQNLESNATLVTTVQPREEWLKRIQETISSDDFT